MSETPNTQDIAAALEKLGATALEIKDERDQLKSVVRWILNDAAYKAPEQITADFVRERYLSRLQGVIDKYT